MNFSGASSRLWDRVFERVRRELGDAPGCHDFAHTLRVLKNAERIASEESGCDPEAVRFGALLHDVARPEELASGGKLCHAALGAEKARRILREEGCMDEAFAEHVSEIVRTHRYRGDLKPATPEARIVYSEAKRVTRLATYIGSSPASSMRASQYTEASGSELRIDLCSADIRL